MGGMGGGPIAQTLLIRKVARAFDAWQTKSNKSLEPPKDTPPTTYFTPCPIFVASFCFSLPCHL